VYRTNQYWGTLGLAVFFGLLSFVLDVSLFLLPAATILAWLLVVEYLFRDRIATISDALAIAYDISQETVQTDQPVSITTQVHGIADFDLQLTLSVEYPDSAVCDQSNPSKTLTTESNTDSLKLNCHFPFAGNYTIGPASVTIESRYGFFTKTLTTSEGDKVTVEPEPVNSMQIGTGDTQFTMSFGDHGSENAGEGMNPAGVRSYMPGDPASRINWKATARLNEVFVREFETETVRPLVVLLDRRQSSHKILNEDPVEYRRNIAISLIHEAETNRDPVGLYDVNTSQIESSEEVNANRNQYVQIRRQLYDTVSEDISNQTANPNQTVQSTVDAASTIDQLRTDQSAFGSKVAPFLRGTPTTTYQVEDEPLIHAAETYLKRHGANARVVILSGDNQRSELYETAKLAGQLGQEVIVFVTPSVLFESEDIAAIDNVYDQYSAFERYRSQLAALEDVTTFEVAPGSQLQSVIKQHKNNSQ
jgi:hypothetical protein